MSIAGYFSDLTGLADEVRFWRGKEDFSDASVEFASEGPLSDMGPAT
jgi:hypothetical protein